MSVDWNNYPCEVYYDELIIDGEARPCAINSVKDLAGMGHQELAACQEVRFLLGGRAPFGLHPVLWVSVLKSLTAYQMYRRSEQVRVQRGPVLRFL